MQQELSGEGRVPTACPVWGLEEGCPQDRGSRMAWAGAGSSPSSALALLMTLGMSPNLSEPPLPHLQNGGDSSIHLESHENLTRSRMGWKSGGGGQGAQFITEIGTVFLKRPESEYFRICGPWSFFHNHSNLHCSMKAASYQTGKSGYGRPPVKLYLQKQAAGQP